MTRLRLGNVIAGGVNGIVLYHAGWAWALALFVPLLVAGGLLNELLGDDAQ